MDAVDDQFRVTVIIMMKRTSLHSALQEALEGQAQSCPQEPQDFLKRDFPGGAVVKNLPAGLPWWRSG